LFGLKIGNNCRKLVAGKPGHQILAAEETEHAFAKRINDKITCRMTMAVIDGLEPVKIEIHYSQGFLVPPATNKFVFQCPVEPAAVGKPGQLINIGKTAGMFKICRRADHHKHHNSRHDGDTGPREKQRLKQAMPGFRR